MWVFLSVWALALFGAYRWGDWPAMWVGVGMAIWGTFFGAWAHECYEKRILRKSGMIKMGEGSDARFVRSTSTQRK